MLRSYKTTEMHVDLNVVDHVTSNRTTTATKIALLAA